MGSRGMEGKNGIFEYGWEEGLKGRCVVVFWGCLRVVIGCCCGNDTGGWFEDRMGGCLCCGGMAVGRVGL
jgi:hypothetical protein